MTLIGCKNSLPKYWRIWMTEESEVQDGILPLEIHELLDRYELLYPDVTELSDLRRVIVDQDLSSVFRISDENDELRKAVIEENLHSIFRVLESKSYYEVDDLYKYMEDVRKAVVNKNLRSLFKLLNAEDLRKICLDKNYWKLWPLLDQYTNTRFTEAFKNFYINNTVIDTDCFSRGQIQSKQWLVEELAKVGKPLGTVFLCAGWYATLATMMFENQELIIGKIRSFDIDPDVVDIAKTFNKPWLMQDWRFQASQADIHDIDYYAHAYQVHRADGTVVDLVDEPNTIINTSCEHIENFSDWYDKIPEGKLVVLQSNNFVDISEHVNVVKSISAFKKSAPMENLLYEGTLKLPKYKRFMLIGYK